MVSFDDIRETFIEEWDRFLIAGIIPIAGFLFFGNDPVSISSFRLILIEYGPYILIGLCFGLLIRSAFREPKNRDGIDEIFK